MDIENAHPSILYQILQCNNIKCDHLKNYITNGQYYLDKVMNEYVDRKIAKTEANSKELQREIRMLKKLSHDKGNELVDLDIRDEYPEKIR